MPHDIIDNRTVTLLDELKRRFPHSGQAKFAVGYFFLSGLEPLRDDLYNLTELRLLIGNTTNRATIEQISEGYRRLQPVQEALEAERYPNRSEIGDTIRATTANVRDAVALMEQSDDGEALVTTLVRLIQDGRLKVRVYTRGRLHAKAYIFDYAPSYNADGSMRPSIDPGVAIVGSSNFTLSGINHNTELNVVVHGAENHAQLTRWFDDLWDESADFDRALMEELRQSWAVAQPTPYDIYMKTLFALVQHRVQEAQQQSFLWTDDINEQLAEFQRVAVRQAIQTIGQYGGCFVADVVGLGKSFIGAAIVKHFERMERARPLIICPKPLEAMWIRYNEVYQLNAHILPMSLLRMGDDPNQSMLLDDQRYRDRDFVLIDESHNFRNPNSQRYKVLQTYLEQGRRCVLLTATPRNSDVWDVYHQLRLFLHTDVTDLPIDPPNLKTFFQYVEAGKRTLPELLSAILIRRTRSHILRWYGYDAETHERIDPEQIALYRSNQRSAYVQVGGQQQTFPRRELQTIDYSIEATYQGLYARLRTAMARPTAAESVLGQARLHYARYDVWHYVLPAKEQKYHAERRTGINLRGLIRTMLFKRFESSVHAFRTTLQRMKTTHQAFLRGLEQGMLPIGADALALLNGNDLWEEPAFVDTLATLKQRYPIEDFDQAALRADIAHDLTVIDEMLALVAPIQPAQDAKLHRLQDVLQDLPGQDKVLIFSQYADTAAYLYANLNPDGRDPTIAMISSASQDKNQLIARFSPRSNPAFAIPSAPPINILIATDVLSEGLNLQECDTVINYDLHWNPVRLIQRFGRIDRIGSTNTTIYGMNFLPELELERNLGLQAKLAQRIRDIHDTIGEDAAILDPSERINERAMYAIYTGQHTEELEDDVDDGMVGLNEAEELLRQLRDDNPAEYERIAQLRDGIRSGRWGTQAARVALFQAGNYQQLIMTDHAGNEISRDLTAILKVLRCDPSELTVPLDPNHNPVLRQLFQRFTDDVTMRQAEQRQAPRLTPAQRYVQRELERLYNLNTDEDLRKQITVVEEAFRGSLSRSVHAELGSLKRAQLHGMPLLQELSTLYLRYALGQQRTGAGRTADDEDSTPKILCSLVVA